MRNSGHLQFFATSDDDYRWTRVATSKGFQYRDVVHTRIEIDDNKVDVVYAGLKQFKSTPAVVCVPKNGAENVDLAHKKRAAFNKRRQASRRWRDQAGSMKGRTIKNIPVPVDFARKGTVSR
jgi:hypothetical protein